MTYSIFSLLHHWVPQVLLLLIAAVVTIYLWSLKTVPQKARKEEMGQDDFQIGK
jgi:hypothetical protein